MQNEIYSYCIAELVLLHYILVTSVYREPNELTVCMMSHLYEIFPICLYITTLT
jgi:hypothetical protein